MKIKVKHNIKPRFEPIKIELVIESEDELLDLFARLNCSAWHINKSKAGYHGSKIDGGTTFELWHTINALCEARIKD